MPDAPPEKLQANHEDQKPAAKALKSTLNLPQTTFPMKANLPENEPKRLAAWQQQHLYAQIRAARAGAAKYILHDGPPYANGAIHLGHALNKCIKDFVVKTKTMAGFDAPYVPGWDCHGLPIEIKVDEQLGRKKLEMDPLAVRRACREYAQKYVDLQRTQFERIGVFGRWDTPYLTMSNGYEASIVETFYDFFEKKFVYKGLRPVYWCIHDKTALAEAEVEYEQHTSPSVYVRYKLTSDPAAINRELGGKSVYTIIWTTTPWTLPASQAVAFNPHLEYVALQTAPTPPTSSPKLCSPPSSSNCNLMSGKNNGEPASQADILARFPGSALEGTTFQHPFLDRSILGVTADYVTADQGTGAVHTSPAHGVDDFDTGKRYHLPEIQYVDNAGRQRHTGRFGGGDIAQPYEDLTVFKSNAPIIELLRERGALLSATTYEHSYPHCWRCHNPIIVRATEQWFIGMETPMLTPEGVATTFRQRALDEIKQVVWDPAWGEERISNMIATRPDWCISRQRIWGVPIAVFLCDKCGEPLNDKKINQTIVDLFKKEGADAWYAHEAAALLPKKTACTSCGHKEFRKEMDILDVWFESGASWHAVLDLEPELHSPADLYTEGGDQHRGWFHSSLLTSVAVRNHAPYKMVATSGWTLDEQGRAFSKSLGNGVDPVDIAKRLGGEIIRLWVASVDFREDVAASENLMQRVSDNYRKLRNTLRFLLSNLYDFDPATNAVALRADGTSRPIHPRPHRRTRRPHPRGLRRLRVPSRLPGSQRVRKHRPQRALPRPLEGSPLHLRPQPPRPPQRADRSLANRRSPHPSHRPHPQLHRRRGLAASPQESQTASPVFTSPSSPTSPTSFPAASNKSKKTGTISSLSAKKSSRSSKRPAPPKRSAIVRLKSRSPSAGSTPSPLRPTLSSSDTTASFPSSSA